MVQGLIMVKQMNKLLHPEVVSRLYGLFYRFRFLGTYIIIGFLSIFLELMIQGYLDALGVHIYLSILVSLGVGILFAFFGNIFFNFKIPLIRRNQAFIYFAVISLFSSFLQWTIAQILDESIWTYEKGRIIISGWVFMIAYLLHRKYSFRNFKKVGVAIYANGVENLEDIFGRIGHYADFIHVDIVDKTMVDDAVDVKTYRLETMKAYWPNTQIQTHIMSYEPTRWLDQVLPYSDVVYIHAECKQNIESLIVKIKENHKKAGIAITMDTKPEEIETLLKKVDYVLLLTVPKPGSSGQKFDSVGLDRIKQINNFSFRKQFVLCIDGGVNENIVGILEAENIVSGSCVLKNVDPKMQIMRLQTAGRYEAA